MTVPVRLAPEVADALAAGVPVVALETSIVAQGLPAPHNLEAALACEELRMDLDDDLQVAPPALEQVVHPGDDIPEGTVVEPVVASK